MTQWTVTVTAAFGGDVPQYGLTHLHNVNRLAEWAAILPEGLGFTLVPSYGGGAGWPVEPGATFIFSGVPTERLADVRAFAQSLRDRERQEAVTLAIRAETFELV